MRSLQEIDKINKEAEREYWAKERQRKQEERARVRNVMSLVPVNTHERADQN